MPMRVDRDCQRGDSRPYYPILKIAGECPRPFSISVQPRRRRHSRESGQPKSCCTSTSEKCMPKRYTLRKSVFSQVSSPMRRPEAMLRKLRSGARGHELNEGESRVIATPQASEVPRVAIHIMKRQRGGRDARTLSPN